MTESKTKTTKTELQKPKQAPNILSCIASDQWKHEVAKVLPKEVTLEAVLRVARSVASEHKFSTCDPRSFLLALLKCARAGLYPDGREAHLIPFGQEVQAVFDWKGIVALANRAGYLVTPKLVHENDRFEVMEDDGDGHTKVVHHADYRKPRGEIQAVYSRAVRPDGQVDYEIMTAEEVEHVRQQYSRAKDSSPWKNSYGEMMKKTVIKRHSKRWDMSPEIRQAINSDDDTPPPFNESKVSTPIFKANPATVEVEAKPEPTPLEQVHSLIVKDGVRETDLVEFLQVIGMADELQESIADLDSGVLAMVVEEWPKFLSKIKEATNETDQRS